MNRGWVKIYRKISDNPYWEEKPFTRGQAWVDIIILANHKDGHIRKRGVKLEVKRGQLGHSQNYLAERWGWSRGKVIRFLSELEIAQQIVQQKNNLTSLITVVNYGDHQDNSTADDTADGTADGLQTVPEQEGKNENKVKKTPPPFRAVDFLLSLGIKKGIATDWLKTRKTKRLANTETAFKSIQREIAKTKHTPNEIIEKCCYEGWGGFKASWLEGDAWSGRKGKDNHISPPAVTGQMDEATWNRVMLPKHGIEFKNRHELDKERK